MKCECQIMEKTSFSIDAELLEKVNGKLSYGDNRSAWLRDAVKMKLEILEITEDLEEDMGDEERREFVVKAVQVAIEEK